MADEQDIIDAIERIRGANNIRWMDLLRLAMRVAPQETKRILQDIHTNDGAVRQLTGMLYQNESAKS